MIFTKYCSIWYDPTKSSLSFWSFEKLWFFPSESRVSIGVKMCKLVLCYLYYLHAAKIPLLLFVCQPWMLLELLLHLSMLWRGFHGLVACLQWRLVWLRNAPVSCKVWDGEITWPWTDLRSALSALWQRTFIWAAVQGLQWSALLIFPSQSFGEHVGILCYI